jgi:hypothetical protein
MRLLVIGTPGATDVEAVVDAFGEFAAERGRVERCHRIVKS